MHTRFHRLRILQPSHLISAIAVLTGVLGLNSTLLAQEEDVLEEMEVWALEQLPEVIISRASGILELPTMVSAQLNLATGMVLASVELGPNSIPAWEKLRQLSIALGEELENADELELEALTELVRLDPSNQVANLQRIVLYIDRKDTAEKRIAAYASFLTPDAIKKIGNQIASRLAFDLAVLQRRTGNTDAYAEYLAKSVELDPSYPTAAISAAGFFRLESTDVLAELELLITAVTADPANDQLLTILGDLLLEHGAYVGAARAYSMASKFTAPSSLLRSDIDEAQSLSLWGSRDVGKALSLIDYAQKIRVEQLMQRMSAIDPDHNRHAFLREDPAPSPRLAILKAAILSDSMDASQLENFFPVLDKSFSYEMTVLQIERTAEEEKDEPSAAMLNQIEEIGLNNAADEAWARVWFNYELDGVSDLADIAESGGSIDQLQRQILDAWLTLRTGKLDEALTAFTDLADQSLYAQTGLALTQELLDFKKEAAKGYLEVYQQEPGTSLGIWSRGRLERILMKTITSSSSVQLLENVMSGMSKSVDRIARDPKNTLAMSISAVENPISYFEPLKVKITLRNTTGIPLAIGQSFPVGSTMAIIADITAAGVRVPEISPVILSTERMFSIPANGEVEYLIDLSATNFGIFLDSMALQGVTMRLRCVVNYKVNNQNVSLDVLGEQAISLPIRMNGFYRSNQGPQDFAKLISNIEVLDELEDLKRIALVGKYLELDVPWIQQVKPDIIDALSKVFSRLGPHARAWVLFNIPSQTSGLSRLLDVAVVSEDVGIYAALLSQWVTSPGSPAIVEGRRSKNPLIREMTEAAYELSNLEETLSRRSYELIDESEDTFVSP